MIKELSCIVVDDDDLDRLAVEIEARASGMKIIGSFDHAAQAAETIRNHQPDVLFLDVEMPGITGLELFRSIQSYSPLCVIISSYPEFAIESFQLKVFDYILKPLTADRFKSCTDRLSDFAEIRAKAEAYTALIENEKVTFKEGHNVIYLKVSDILYLEAFGDYTKVVTRNKNYLTLATLGGFLEDLPADKFTRIHRSYAVCKDQISHIGNTSVVIADVNLPVGKTYRSFLRQIRS